MGLGSRARRAALGGVAGFAWAQLSIYLANVVAPKYLLYGDSVATGAWFRLASWTVAGPWTAAQAFQGDNRTAAIAACSATTAAVCSVASLIAGRPQLRRAVASALIVLCGLCLVSTTGVALQFRDLVAADSAFYVLLGHSEFASREPAVVEAARVFVARHPYSRWRGEMLRIVAMAEWDAGRVAAARELWHRFGAGFRDPLAPGVAYAEYSQALCDERLGLPNAAERHLRNAVRVIWVRGDGIQAWIAEDSAARLARIHRTDGLVELSNCWKMKSVVFADMVSIQ